MHTVLLPSRLGGDGESLPETPPNEEHTASTKTTNTTKSSEIEKCKLRSMGFQSVSEDEEIRLRQQYSLGSGGSNNSNNNPFTIQITIDGLALLLFLFGVATRMYNLDKPR